MKIKKRSDQRGFAMLEVLASVLILAFCLLSIASLLLFTQKSNSSSYIKQQAIEAGYDIIDLMRSNRAVAISGSYAVSNLGGAPPAAPTPSCQSTTACTAANLAAWDLYVWQTRLAQFGGSGQIVTATATLPPPATGAVATVKIQWNDAPTQQVLGGSTGAVGASANLSQVVLTSQL